MQVAKKDSMTNTLRVLICYVVSTVLYLGMANILKGLLIVILGIGFNG